MKKDSNKIRAAVSQINPTVGDFAGNLSAIEKAVAEAKEAGALIIVFPELVLCGYPPEDLLYKKMFLHQCKVSLKKAAALADGIILVVGSPELAVTRRGNSLYNSAFILCKGDIAAVYRKIHLPNYGVFDEKRYFSPGTAALVADTGAGRIGLTVCEDIWVENGPSAAESKILGADVILNLSASPYHKNKCREREKLMQKRAREAGAALCFANLTGGQDELVFDGTSLIIDRNGKTLARANAFREDLLVADIEFKPRKIRKSNSPLREKTPYSLESVALPAVSVPGKARPVKAGKARHLDPDQEVYTALLTGTRDYTLKNGFEQVVLGLSGGIDSALTAVIAVDALGAEKVNCVTMPSEFTTEESLRDSRTLAENLGVKFFEYPITGIYRSYIENLPDLTGGKKVTVTEENIQARIRGNILMAFSNRYGWLVLTTGNKSELAVGYCTLYGDMAGGFSVLKDVPKTLVYSLCRHRNAASGGTLIPQSIIQRKPSAELRPGQLDQDTLPPYAVLDRIIELYVEEDLGLDEIIKKGLDPVTAEKMINRIDKNEYKRRQGPPGIKITPKAFGKDRRLPITNIFKKL